MGLKRKYQKSYAFAEDARTQSLCTGPESQDRRKKASSGPLPISVKGLDRCRGKRKPYSNFRVQAWDEDGDYA